MGRLINVCAHLDQDSTRRRETRALEEGMNSLNIKQSYLLTADQEEQIQTQAGIIHVTPAWKWLCQASQKTKNIIAR